MPRVRGSPKTRHRRKKWLKLAKGYRGKRGHTYRTARLQVMKSLAYAYQDRKRKKREFRKLAILQINIKCREAGLPYNQFMWGLKKLNIGINRKELALLARENPNAFYEIVNKVKNSLAS